MSTFIFRGTSYITLTNLKAELEATSSAGITKPTGVLVGGFPVDYFVSAKNGCGIQIAVSEDSLRWYLESGYESQVKAITISSKLGQRISYIEIKLVHLDQLLTFGTFIDHLLGELQDTDADPGKSIVRVFEHWKKLFLPERKRFWSLEEQIGLCCELAELYSLIQSSSPLAIQSWYGPDSERHDFETLEKSIECKATRSNQGLNVRIHGRRQLEQNGDKPLDLVVRQYDRDPSGHESVPNLCQKILNYPGVSQSSFLEKLAEHDLSVEDISNTDLFETFTLVKRVRFNVGSDFPKIDSSLLHPLVVNVNYVLDLTDVQAIPGYMEG